MRVGISAKILGIFILVSIGVVAVLAFNNIANIRDRLEAEFLTGAIVAARSLDATITSMADLEDDSQLFAIVHKAIWLNPDILRIDVNRPVNGILTTTVSSDPANVGKHAGAPSIRSLDDDRLFHSFRSNDEGMTLLLTIPIHVARKQRGAFEVEFTLEAVEKKIIDAINIDLLLFAFTITTSSIFLFVFIRAVIIRPLEKLRNGVREFGLAGAMPALDLKSRDEIGDLSRGINRMAVDLSETQERLRRSHRLEAVGQLTGGVAHDFNNLLAVIMGNAELLKNRLGTDDKLLDDILRATQRGEELTQRLLAFSRQQPLQPQVIDLGELVSGMSELLTRTLGETIGIEIGAEPDLWLVSADPGQVENALLNLALNARDAMPDGGKLTITSANARLDGVIPEGGSEPMAEDYVVLAVGDTGYGMTAEVQAHAFEPFYTTKEVGQGSGLGLSMVYGFAKQSGGHVKIDSEEGRGTTVELYLPRAAPAARSEEASQKRTFQHGRGEVILVIEDDPNVRDLVVRMVEGLGYRVLEAPDVAAARKLLAGGTDVDLVLSDVLLPGGTSGPEFAAEEQSTRPGLKFIFMSGYPAGAGKLNSVLGPDKVLLGKPFQLQQLAAAVSKELDQDISD